MNLDLEKYQGLFYEVYRQKADFEILCNIPPFGKPSNVTAEYKLIEPGTLSVKNKCSSAFGDIVVTGKATVNPKLKPGQLLLTLDLYVKNVDAIYEVFYTDYDNISIVGNLSTGYLSFLSRKSTISMETFNLMCALCRSYGFTIN